MICRLALPRRARRPLGAGLVLGLAFGLMICAPGAASLPAVVAAGLPSVADQSTNEPADATVPGDPRLQLVTLEGPGTSGGSATRDELLGQQQALLAEHGIEPVYQWTTALNGFAAPLTAEQVRELSGAHDVALIEPNEVLPTADRPGLPIASEVASPRTSRAGSGAVIGFVDSGLDPSLPVFSDLPALGPAPSTWGGRCVTGEGWSEETCRRKIIGATWFVAGFGEDRLRSAEQLSARDGSGHGTGVSALAAGNAGVTVQLPGDQAGGTTFSGTAPSAWIAVYKACWTAPDPSDDGCATADVVSAIDQATADGVDVVNLSVGSDDPTAVGTLDRALLGAAEAEIVVVAAAGNNGQSSYAAHDVPWVTTVGAVSDPLPQMRLVAPGGRSWTGAGRAARRVPAAPIVWGRQIPAPGSPARAAAQCRPGTLDAAAAGAIVVCERGGTGRVDKSAEVAAADGVGMVLLNTGPGAVSADVHSVPTVHLDQQSGASLRAWLSTSNSPARGWRLRPAGRAPGGSRVPSWSPEGNPRSGLLKPDLVAAGGGLVTAGLGEWQVLAGTSAAAARVSGAAARLAAQTGWDGVRIQSSLATTAVPVAGNPTRTGSGRFDPDATARLVLDENRGAYRDVLAGRRSVHSLNLPSVVLSGQRPFATRRLTNTGKRSEYFSGTVEGLDGVVISPEALRLDPGETGSFTIQASGTISVSDSGTISWRGARGSRTRIPVLMSR